MLKYIVEIRETLSRIIEVEASSENEALSIVQGIYDKEEIVLDYMNFDNVAITVMAEEGRS